jgi:hypothetical protein
MENKMTEYKTEQENFWAGIFGTDVNWFLMQKTDCKI